MTANSLAKQLILLPANLDEKSIDQPESRWQRSKLENNYFPKKGEST